MTFDIFIKEFIIQNQTMNASIPMTGKKIENYVFNYCDFLGNGNFSKCYKARNTITNEVVAIKIVELNSLKSKKLQQLLFSEIEVLKEMNHPNVLRCHEVFTSNRNCYIITELCNEGDLENKIKKKQRLDQIQINNIIADVYKGLKYLASKNIVHRDLKIANIFVHNGVAKIADFGFALHSKTNFRDLNIGSPLYMSPEGILDNVYGPKTDVWAFGIMLYQLYHGKTPFNYCQTEDELRTSVSRQLQWNQLKNEIPNEVKELILSCLEVRQDKRPTIPQLANTSFLHRIVHNREVQTNTQLKFKSPIKHKDSKIYDMQEEQVRGRSHMKMRSAYSTQDQTYFTNRPMQRVISPNKTYTSNNQLNSYNSVNNSFNHHSTHNFFESAQNSNMPNLAINLPAPKIKQSVTMNDRSMQNITSIKSPVTFADETLNKTQPTLNISKKVYIITAQINFKECVSILHYCRLIFKYLHSFKELTSLNDQSCKQHYAALAQFLIFCLDQIFDFVSNKKIKYEGENPEVREKKLFEVTEEYRSKYNKELDTQIIKRCLDERQKNDLSLSTIQHLSATQSSSFWLSQKSSFQQLLVGELLLVIYSSTLLLEECFNKRSYSQIQKYKEIEETLNKSKDSFTYSNYAKHKNRVFSSKLFSPR